MFCNMEIYKHYVEKGLNTHSRKPCPMEYKKYIYNFSSYAGPFGIPLIVIGFIIILASVYLNGGRSELWGALLLIVGAIFWKLNQPGGLFGTSSSGSSGPNL